jgi:AcrR family transcriptional regulator
MTVKGTYHHGDLRQKIIEAALLWIETENIVSLSLRSIARNIGVSHNAPYRHFPDKESLLIAIAEIGFQQLQKSLQQALVNSPDDAQQRVENLGIAYIQYAVENQAYYRVMFSDRYKNAGKNGSVSQLAEKAFEVLLDAIKVGQQSEVFTPEDCQQLAYVCWSLVHGVSMLAIDRQLMASDPNSVLELARIATKTVCKGLRKETEVS